MAKPVYILIIAALIFIISLGVSTNLYVKSKTTTQPILMIGSHLYLIDTKDTTLLINTLNNNEELEGKYIGIGNSPTASYPIYTALGKVANETTLFNLTYHKNPKLRVCGMWGLKEKNEALALTRMRELQNDSAIVEYRNGCFGGSWSAAYLMALCFVGNKKVSADIITKDDRFYFVAHVKD